MVKENKQKGFHERKNEWAEYYNEWVKYWVKIDCIACSGTGYYESFGSPLCNGCNGTGNGWDKLPYEEGNTVIEEELGNIKGEELGWMFWDNKGNKIFIGQFENVIN